MEHLYRAEKPLDAAETFAGEAYWSPQAAALEEEHIFKKSWLYFCKAADVADPGHYAARQVCDQSIVVTRDRDGTLRALSNVCLHRAGPIMEEGHGKAASLTCRYHRWAYGLDGALRAAPDFPELDPTPCRLPEFQVAEWGPFIFIALEDPGQTLEEALGPVLDWAENYEIEKLAHSYSSSFIMQCNWKAFVENSLEAYHVPTIHPILWASTALEHYRTTVEAPLITRQTSSQDDMREEYGLADPALQALLKAVAPPLPKLTTEEQKISQFINLFPTFILNLNTDHVNTVWAEPLDADHTRITLDYWFLPERARPPQSRFGKWLRRTLDSSLTKAAEGPMPDTDAMAKDDGGVVQSALFWLLQHSGLLRKAVGAELARYLTLYYTDLTLREDMGIARDTQRNLKSGAYQYGRLVPAHENALHHFQNYVRRMINKGTPS